MRKITTVLAGSVALVLGCLIASSPGIGDNENDSGDAMSPFEGQVIVTGSKSHPNGGSVLENPRIQKLGERHFLVGTAAGYGGRDGWTNGRAMWIPIDDLFGITVFANLDEYKKATRPMLGSPKKTIVPLPDTTVRPKRR